MPEAVRRKLEKNPVIEHHRRVDDAAKRRQRCLDIIDHAEHIRIDCDIRTGNNDLDSPRFHSRYCCGCIAGDFTAAPYQDEVPGAIGGQPLSSCKAKPSQTSRNEVCGVFPASVSFLHTRLNRDRIILERENNPSDVLCLCHVSEGIPHLSQGEHPVRKRVKAPVFEQAYKGFKA
jgi:hypothetical protein